MPINPFNTNEESSFEQGISLNRPVKAVNAQSQQQAKAFKADLLAQLYGPGDTSNPEDGNVDPNKAAQARSASSGQAAQAAVVQKKPVHKLGGMSDSGDHAKYAAMQKQLEAGDKKGADDTMHHMQYYYDTTIGTLEEQVKKARQKRQQEEQEREKQSQEEEQKKKQKLEEKKNDVPRPIAKGRNRMGGKGKTDMGLEMGKKKTETFRGSSG